MKLNYDLSLEQSQKLIMTPELRQAIQLLQYTSLELNDYLSHELEENPLLEMERPIEELQNIESLNEEKDIDWKEFIEKYDDISYRTEVDRNHKEYSVESFISYVPSLKDFLMEQLNMVTIGSREKLIAEYLIQNINGNGYMETELKEIGKILSVSTEEVELMLGVIQGFEPIGVGARTLKECLFIQTKDMKDVKLNEIINNHLEDIATNRLINISKSLGISIERAQDYCDIIKSLEPKPGRTYRGEGEDIRYIIPDATIEEVDGEYVIFINEITGPRLNINEYYKNLIKSSKDEKTSEFLQDKLNSALWIIKSIEQRRQTLYKVIVSIVGFQKSFFKYGEKNLIPLTLKDVALDIDMHESTVSRATNGKYVQTPRGVFELKYFFTTGLASSSGDVSAIKVKAIIKGMIDEENPKKPLSDQLISEALKARGMIVSRRTVAKYRDELNIPSSSMRRRY